MASVPYTVVFLLVVLALVGLGARLAGAWGPRRTGTTYDPDAGTRTGPPRTAPWAGDGGASSDTTWQPTSGTWTGDGGASWDDHHPADREPAGPWPGDGGAGGDDRGSWDGGSSSDGAGSGSDSSTSDSGGGGSDGGGSSGGGD